MVRQAFITITSLGVKFTIKTRKGKEWDSLPFCIDTMLTDLRIDYNIQPTHFQV